MAAEDTPTEDHSQTDKNDDKNYWLRQIHPDLLPVVKSYPKFALTATYDSWLKRTLLQFGMSPRGPSIEGVAAKHIPKVGTLYSPSSTTAQTKTENETTTRKEATTKAAILWIHGGGRIVGTSNGVPESYLCSKLVQLLDLPVLSASHRLAPKHVFPAALDDLMEAYRWLVDYLLLDDGDDDDENDNTGEASDDIPNNQKYENDENSPKQKQSQQNSIRIILAGESSGGGLAAELSQRLLDERSNDHDVNLTSSELPTPAAQILFYPMLDDRTCTNEEIIRQSPKHWIWNARSNIYAWKSYLGPKYRPGQEDLPAYASAARREDMAHLPPAFVVCGTLDIFHKECKDYVKKLKEGNVDVEFMEVDGAFHGFMLQGTVDLMKSGKTEPGIVREVWDRIDLFARKYL
ncbi:hypothetical protein ACHAXS_008957 [Conticribra weissflogii]